MYFDNPEDIFAWVSQQIKRSQSLGFSVDQSSPVEDKISTKLLDTAKADIEISLIMSSQDFLLPENYSALSATLSIYTAAPDLSAERAFALEKLKENLPYFSLTLRRAKKDQEEYYKKAAKKESGPRWQTHKPSRALYWAQRPQWQNELEVVIWLSQTKSHDWSYSLIK